MFLHSWNFQSPLPLPPPSFIPMDVTIAFLWPHTLISHNIQSIFFSPLSSLIILLLLSFTSSSPLLYPVPLSFCPSFQNIPYHLYMSDKTFTQNSHPPSLLLLLSSITHYISSFPSVLHIHRYIILNGSHIIILHILLNCFSEFMVPMHSLSVSLLFITFVPTTYSTVPSPFSLEPNSHLLSPFIPFRPQSPLN